MCVFGADLVRAGEEYHLGQVSRLNGLMRLFGIDLPQRPGLTMFTLVLSYLVTCFRNQATRLFLVAALRSKLTLGTIRNFTTLAGDGSDTYNAQCLLDVPTDLCLLNFRRRSGLKLVAASPLQVQLPRHASHGQSKGSPAF